MKHSNDIEKAATRLPKGIRIDDRIIASRDGRVIRRHLVISVDFDSVRAASSADASALELRLDANEAAALGKELLRVVSKVRL